MKSRREAMFAIALPTPPAPMTRVLTEIHPLTVFVLRGGYRMGCGPGFLSEPRFMGQIRNLVARIHRTFRFSVLEKVPFALSRRGIYDRN